MKPLQKIASELLGFDRRERRAAYVLAVILLVLLALRVLTLRPGNAPVATVLLSGGDTVTPPHAEKEVGLVTLFRFDPNTASSDDLVRLGFTERQATTLINYRNTGARFHDAHDLGRVYGIDSILVARLAPWVSINAGNKSGNVSREHGAGGSAVFNMQPVNSPVPVPIDLNRCSASDLEQLPGIGVVLSERIIKYRNLLGGFAETSQLREVYGLDSSTVELIGDRVMVSPDAVIPVMLDSCTFAQMARHPYIGPEAARAIMKYRSLMGVPFTLQDLVIQRVISASQAERIAPYFRTGNRQSER